MLNHQTFLRASGCRCLIPTNPTYRHGKEWEKFSGFLKVTQAGLGSKMSHCGALPSQRLDADFPESLGARAHLYLEKNVEKQCPTRFTLGETEAGQRLVHRPRTSPTVTLPFISCAFLELSSLADPRQACCAETRAGEGMHAPGREGKEE